MDGHEIHPFFRVGPDNLEKVLRGDIQQVLFQVADGIIHGDCADHGGGQFDELLAKGVGFAVIGQVHNGLCSKSQGHTDLVHLGLVVVGVSRDP